MNKILELKFGSHLYGTDTPNSDLDFKAIYLPTAKEICLNSFKRTICSTRPKQTGERNTKEDVDVEIISLDRFMTLLTEGQTMALDILFAPDDSYTFRTERGKFLIEKIRQLRSRLLNKNLNAFVGYARQQAAKYGQKGFRIHALRTSLEMVKAWQGKVDLLGECDLEHWAPYVGNEHVKIVHKKNNKGIDEPFLDVAGKYYAFHSKLKYVEKQLQERFDEYGKRALMAEKNEGVDWKALSHAVRVNSEAVELLTTQQITFPRPDAELLLKIKLGQLPYTEVADLIEKGLDDLKAAQEVSTLPDKPDLDLADEIVYDVYSEIVKNG